MMPSEFDWREGQVTFWDLCEIDDNVSLESQIEKLKEDMAQARFGECTTLDVGWYPEFAPDGSFVVVVIREQNWDAPLFKQEASTVADLRRAIVEGISAACIDT